MSRFIAFKTRKHAGFDIFCFGSHADIKIIKPPFQILLVKKYTGMNIYKIRISSILSPVGKSSFLGFSNKVNRLNRVKPGFLEWPWLEHFKELQKYYTTTRWRRNGNDPVSPVFT